MSLKARLVAFIMCHVGFFATIFLLVSFQPAPSDIDAATAALEQSEKAGTVVMAGGMD